MNPIMKIIFVIIFISPLILAQEVKENENPYRKFIPYAVETDTIINNFNYMEIDNLGKEQPARWLSVDPLADKYPGWSPYNYTLNNPLRYIDPNGKEIAIAIGSNKNGSVKYVTYFNGKLYEGGKIYTGNNEFAAKIQQTLNNLVSLNDSKVNSMISTLQSKTGRFHLISSSIYGGDHVASSDPYKSNLGQKTGSNVRVTLSSEPIENGLKTTPETVLGHELQHSLDFDQGIRKGYYEEIDIPGHLNPAEIRAVNMENRVRAIQGLDKRKTYNNEKINEQFLD